MRRRITRPGSDEKFMRLAVGEAGKNLAAGRGRPAGGPFGACIVKGGRVVAAARNTVIKNNDATAHAEINAIRLASKKLRTFDLSGCRIYSTAEPCPMCFSAIHWAKIGVVIYGAAIADARKAGFNELTISNALMKKLGRAKIRIRGGFLAAECRRLFEEWKRLENKVSY